jgi:hypothetical protein
LVISDHQVQLESLAQREWLVRLVLLDPKDHMVMQEYKVLRDPRDNLGILELMELQASQVNRVHKV